MNRPAFAIEQFRRAEYALLDRRLALCLALLDAAQAAGYSDNECDACRWNCWMLLGRFCEAWAAGDRIASRGCSDSKRLWDGRPFDGNRLMIRCLHGFGDAIQFLRYARLVRRSALSVVAQTHPELVRLVRGIDGIDAVTTWPEDPLDRSVQWNQQIEVMELPRAFRTSLATIPSATPYLAVDPQACRESLRGIGEGARPRVGLLWESGEWDQARNVPFAALRPILVVPGVEFFSFQRGAGRAVLRASVFGEAVRDLSGDSADVVPFAADLTNMDLLITVDTMAAHLAGALARPVWVLLPFRSDWRWMIDRRDSPWYPTMRLFRQPASRDWSVPLRECAAQLSKLAGR